MQKSSIIAVAATAMLVGASAVNAGFVVTTSRAAITSGQFAGDDGVTLLIRNDGVGTTDPTFGADLIYYEVGLSSTAANPRFFIQTWDGTLHNTTASANVQADFGYQGFVQGDATRDGQVTLADFSTLATNFGKTGVTWSQADFTGDGQVTLADFSLLATNFGSVVSAGSNVRFGTNAQVPSFFPLSFTPTETSQTFTSGQAVPTFQVEALVLTSAQAGLPDSVATQLAYAVVPTGEPVTFAGLAQAHAGNVASFSITDTAGALSPALSEVPEPAALGLVGFAGLLLRRSRKSASK